MSSPAPLLGGSGTELGSRWGAEHWPVYLAIAGVTALAWAYLWRAAAEMDSGMAGMADMVMPRDEPWGPADLGLTFAMWAVMMLGMMLPGAAPTIALFAALDRRRRSSGIAPSMIGAFGAGYLTVWTGFSIVATLLQWGLDSALLLTMAQALAGPLPASGLLILVGLYQLTPLKRACLARCRSPLGFLLSHWRNGQWGAFRLGLLHGAWCLGCCSFLMLLLFVGGAMNLVWAAGLALLVMAEKLLPRGDQLARASGLLFGAAGAWVILQTMLG